MKYREWEGAEEEMEEEVEEEGEENMVDEMNTQLLTSEVCENVSWQTKERMEAEIEKETVIVFEERESARETETSVAASSVSSIIAGTHGMSSPDLLPKAKTWGHDNLVVTDMESRCGRD